MTCDIILSNEIVNNSGVYSVWKGIGYMNKIKAAIIFGGRSNEHEVSIQSAKSVISNINADKYDLHLIGITRQGEWRLFDGDVDNIESWIEMSRPIVLPPDPSYRGYFLTEEPQKIYKLEVAFPVMHGTYAEDGTIQSVLELAGIPYVGPEVLSSAVAMDKVVAKQVCGFNGIPQCKFCSCTAYEWSNNKDGIIAELENELGYPIFVKPANMGSSVGISKAKNREDLINAIDTAFVFDRKIVAEEFVDGREIECAVIGNDECMASVPGEVVSAKEFYDYEAKYDDSFDSATFIPARLEKGLLEDVRKLALKTYKVLNCRGLCRIDFFVTKSDNKILLNEANTLPGFTKISMYPKMMINMGISYSELIDKLFELAVENAQSKNRIHF